MDNNNNMSNPASDMEQSAITMEEFLEMVKDAVSEKLKDCTVEIQISRKNNSVVRHGIMIKSSESNCAPFIYLDADFEAYKCGRSLDDIVESVVEAYRQDRDLSGFNITEFLDYEKIKHKICCKLVNTEMNKELLEDVPSIPFLDLSVIFYVLIQSTKENCASITIHNDHMECWGINTEELFEIAKVNTPKMLDFNVKSVFSVLMEGLDIKDDGMPIQQDNRMYVATSSTNSNGAAAFLNASLLSEFADKIGRDFYILPSSIHEIIFLPLDETMEPECFKQMIAEINSVHVRPEEVLSNNLYIYKRQSACVEIAA